VTSDHIAAGENPGEEKSQEGNGCQLRIISATDSSDSRAEKNREVGPDGYAFCAVLAVLPASIVRRVDFRDNGTAARREAMSARPYSRGKSLEGEAEGRLRGEINLQGRGRSKPARGRKNPEAGP